MRNKLNIDLPVTRNTKGSGQPARGLDLDWRHSSVRSQTPPTIRTALSWQGWYLDRTEPSGFLAKFVIQHCLIFVNRDFSLQLNTLVLIVSRYDIYVKDAVLDTAEGLFLQFAIQSIFIESLQTTPEGQNYVTTTN